MQSGGFDKGELEIRVRDLMKLMEPGYLEAKGSDARAMRNLFIAAAVSLAELGGGISDEERKVLQQFLGKEFDLDKLNSDQLANLLPDRLRDANQETSRSQRMQLIRDLALVARADVDGEEDKVKRLKSLAQRASGHRRIC